jgi:hypothetical protein
MKFGIGNQASDSGAPTATVSDDRASVGSVGTVLNIDALDTDIGVGSGIAKVTIFKGSAPGISVLSATPSTLTSASSVTLTIRQASILA